jgi:hypothetical protein
MKSPGESKISLLDCFSPLPRVRKAAAAEHP